MAEYFNSKSEAEAFIQEWHSKNGSRPVHFAKILNHGEEKYIVNYDHRQNPAASPYIKVIADYSAEVTRLIQRPESTASDRSPSK